MSSDWTPSKRLIVRDRDTSTSGELFLVRGRFKSRLLSWSESASLLVAWTRRISQTHTKTRGDSSSQMVPKRFPIQIDRDVRLNVLEPRHSHELFKLVDSNRTHLREWLPFIDDYQSVTAATQFIRRNREENDGATRLVRGSWAGEILAGVVTFDYIDWSTVQH